MATAPVCQWASLRSPAEPAVVARRVCGWLLDTWRAPVAQFNDVRYFLNFDKLLALGWKPEVDFDQGERDPAATSVLAPPATPGLAVSGRPLSSARIRAASPAPSYRVAGLQLTVEWYKNVAVDWWPIGTDSALAAHPTAVPATLDRGLAR